LSNAIDTAKELFKKANRPEAKKVLVIFSDVRSGSDPNDVIQATKTIQDDDVIVIAIPLGTTGSPDELGLTTTDKDDVLPSENSEDPNKVRDRIIDRIFNRKLKVNS
jgi:hypothetical protein